MGVGFSDDYSGSKPDKKAISDTFRENIMPDIDPMTMKLDYGRVEKIEIKPKGRGWEWSIVVPGKVVATGFCLTLDSAIDRVKQMTEPQWKEAV